MKDKKKFKALNIRLQNLLDEQSDLDILLNPSIKWEEKDQSYKNWLDFKYAGREFDISSKWKEKVQLEKSNQLSGKDYDEEIFINTNRSRNRMFRYLGNKEWEELDIGPLGAKNINGTGAAVGDLTGNGFLDIFITVGD